MLFFAAPLVEAVSDFSPGDAAVLLPVRGHLDEHGDLLRDRLPGSGADLRRRGGSELLTTITNDAWFGRTSAPYQHFAQASMRAIENGRYLVRSANTGISGIVDPYGRVLAQTDIFQQAVVVGEARFVRERTDLLAHRRRVRLRVGGADARGAGRRPPPCKIARCPPVDELRKRYDDLSRRAADLRSYL